MVSDSRLSAIVSKMIGDPRIYTSSELASLLKVCSRTVKSDIQTLNDYLREYDVQILSLSGQGYQMVAKDPALFDQLKQTIREKTGNSKSVSQYSYERVNYIIKKLLAVDYYLKIDDLADELYVSASTIKRELREVRARIAEYRLKIEIKPNYGIILVGCEKDKRLCISEYYFNNDVQTGFFAADNAMFVSETNQEEIIFISETLKAVLERYHLMLCDSVFEDMVIHIIVALRRWRFYNFVSISKEEALNIHSQAELSAAKELVYRLEEHFNYLVPESENLYFAMHLANKCIKEKNEISDKERQLVCSIMADINSYLSCKYGLKPKENQEYQNYMMLHVPPMLQRLQCGMTVRNQQTYEILQDYPLAAHITVDVFRKIKKKYGISVNIEELSYLVLYTNLLLMHAVPQPHILFICFRGRAEMVEIKTCVEEYMLNLAEGIDYCTFFNAKSKNLDQYDLILTTIDVTPLLDFPQNTLQKTFQCAKPQQIYQYIIQARMKACGIRNFIKKEYVIQDIKGTDRKQVLQRIARQFKEKEKQVFDLLFTDENFVSGEVGNGVAFIHAPHTLNEDFILLATLKKPII